MWHEAVASDLGVLADGGFSFYELLGKNRCTFGLTKA